MPAVPVGIAPRRDAAPGLGTSLELGEPEARESAMLAEEDIIRTEETRRNLVPGRCGTMRSGTAGSEPGTAPPRHRGREAAHAGPLHGYRTGPSNIGSSINHGGRKSRPFARAEILLPPPGRHREACGDSRPRAPSSPSMCSRADRRAPNHDRPASTNCRATALLCFGY
jgi:hypothetical protein